MVASPKGLGPEKDCAGKGQQHIQTTDPFSRQRGRPKSTNPQLSDNNTDLVVSPRRVLYSKTDWPADRRSYNFDFESEVIACGSQWWPDVARNQWAGVAAMRSHERVGSR
jgi:hypothetical protein